MREKKKFMVRNTAGASNASVTHLLDPSVSPARFVGLATASVCQCLHRETPVALHSPRGNFLATKISRVAMERSDKTLAERYRLQMFLHCKRAPGEVNFTPDTDERRVQKGGIVQIANNANPPPE